MGPPASLVEGGQWRSCSQHGRERGFEHVHKWCVWRRPAVLRLLFLHLSESVQKPERKPYGWVKVSHCDCDSYAGDGGCALTTRETPMYRVSHFPRCRSSENEKHSICMTCKKAVYDGVALLSEVRCTEGDCEGPRRRRRRGIRCSG